MHILGANSHRGSDVPKVRDVDLLRYSDYLILGGYLGGPDFRELNLQILEPSKGPSTQIVDKLGPNGFLYGYFGHLSAYLLGTWTLRPSGRYRFVPIHHHSDPWPARCQRPRFRSDLQRGFHPEEGSSSILGCHFLGGFP